MDWQSYYVLGLTLLMLVLLVTGRMRVDAIGLLLMVALVAAGILSYSTAVEGLGNKAILTIAGLFVVGEGLTRTGAVEFVARFLMRVTLGEARRTGILYLTCLAPRLLPRRQSLTTMMGASEAREYLTELVIGPTSPLRARPYSEVVQKVRARLAFYVRDETMVWGPFEGHVIQPGDVLMLQGGVDEIAALETELDLKHVAGQRSGEKEMTFFELAISPHSPLVGRQAEELQLWRDYGAVTVAILRAGQHIRERLSKLHLRAGDLLLVMADEEAEARLQASADFYVVSGGAQRMVKLRHRGRRALLIAALVVVFFALTSLVEMPWLPQPFVAILGALGMIATGCVTPRRVYRSIDWPILIFIAGTLALGQAMQATGSATVIAQGIVDLLAEYGAPAILSGFVLLCIVMNTLIAHSAVAVLLTPIAIKTAQELAIARGLGPGDPEASSFLRACILAIAFGGSLCFATPVGHQVNLMVMGPGGYRYSDFVRLGLPLSLIAWVVISLGLPLLVGL